MDVTFLGAGCVKLSGKSLTVVCDPYSSDSGLPTLNIKADLVTLSGSEGLGQLSGVDQVFAAPGEYEMHGVSIIGVPARLHLDESGERGTVFSFDLDGVRVVVAGNIAGKLDERQVERLGQANVLIVPVGGNGLTMDATGAAELVAQLEPNYVIPVHYDDGKTKYAMPQAGVGEFLKEMGAGEIEPISKLKVSGKGSGDLPPETEIVVLQHA